MLHAQGPGAFTRRYVEWILRHGRTLWIIAGLLFVPALYRTVTMYANLRSEVEELLPQDAESVKALDEMRRRFPGLQYLSVVVEYGDKKNIPAAEKFLDDLAARIRTYPPELVREVRTGSFEERAFIEKHAPLYISLDDLKEIRRRIEARRDYEVSKESGFGLDDEGPVPAVEFKDLEAKYKDKIDEGGESHARFTSEKIGVSMLFIEVGGYDSGASKSRQLLNRVKADAKDLGGTDKYAPGMRMGYASDVAINVEETEALETDLGISSALVIAVVVALLVTFYKWWKSVFVLFPPLLVATAYAFGLSSLPPMNVTELNSNTAFLGSIIVGNGINMGLMLLARYREERRRGVAVDDAITVSVWGAFLGTLAAATAAAVSYASLIVTEFRGFRQFGYIGGFGLVMSWITAFTLLPPLIKWLDRGETVVKDEGRGVFDFFTNGIVRLVQRTPGGVLAVATVLTLVSAGYLSTWTTSRLETNFATLRRVDTWEHGEGYWGRKMDAALGRYLTPTVILTDSVDQTRAIEEKVRSAMKEGGTLQKTLAEVRSLDDVVPPKQAEKIREIEGIRELMTPKIRSLIPEDKRETLDRFLGEETLKPFGPDEVPRTFLTGLRERDGTVGKSLLVFPKPSDLLWQREYIDSFVVTLRGFGAEARKANETPARLAGSIPLTADILTSIDRDAPRATVVAFVGVLLTVFVVVRRLRPSLLVIGALIIGVLWLAGAMMAFDIKINFCNFIAFPITLGIGVDYAVNVISRFVQDGEDDVSGAIRSTGGAVTMCSLTTIIGYSSLLIAKNKALYLFGALAVLGEFTCLATAVVALPALLSILSRRQKLARGPSPKAA